MTDGEKDKEIADLKGECTRIKAEYEGGLENKRQ